MARAGKPLDPRDAAALDAWVKADPVGFVEDVLGIYLWSKQRQIIESVRDNPRTAVRSSRGVGKTTVAACAALWFLAAHGPEALVVTTAPTWAGVKDLLWREIRSAYQNSRGFYGPGRLTETRLDFGEKWFAVGRSTNRATNFQGYHSDNVLFIVDEASGVAEQIYEAAEGFFTAENARSLLIGNPNFVGGHFYKAFAKEGAGIYKRFHMGVFDTPAFTGEQVPAHVLRSLPTRDWVEDMKKLYRVPDEDERGGTGVRLNPVYEVHVLGRFPSQGSKAVVPMFEVENAQAREQEMPTEEMRPESTDELRALYEMTWPTVIGCDVARFGEDNTCITLRQGNRVRIMEVINGQDTMATAGSLARLARENQHPLYGKPTIAIDDSGVGGGVTDRLREIARDDPEGAAWSRVVAFNGGNAAADVNAREYPNARSELWFEFAEDWLPELDLDDDEDLLSELCAPEYEMNSKGQRVVEPKAVTKKRIGYSPDRADAVMVAFCRGVSAAHSAVAPSGPVTPGGSRWAGMGGSGGGRSTWRRM